MRAKLTAAFCLGFLASGAWTFAQTCIVQAPPAPPIPEALVVFIPQDGGTSGCTVEAPVAGGERPQRYAISGTKCAQAVSIAKQAAANDNGWNDGGAP